MIKRIAQLAMASMMWVAVAGPAKAQDNKTVYVIDKKVKHQVIDNFGASDAWRCDFIGKYWPEEKREQIADLLFKREFDEQGNVVLFQMGDIPEMPNTEASRQAYNLVRQKLAKAGIEVGYSKEVKTGFKLGEKNGGYYISFTDESFDALLKEYLREKVSNMLFK